MLHRRPWSRPWPRTFSSDCSVWPSLGRVLVVSNFFHF
jgi:hypothetical protein